MRMRDRLRNADARAAVRKAVPPNSAQALPAQPALQATGAAAWEFRQLTESAAKLACGMLGIFKVNASALRSGTGVAIALAIFQAARAIKAMRRFEKGDRAMPSRKQDLRDR
jgi:hypothetical protein